MVVAGAHGSVCALRKGDEHSIFIFVAALRTFTYAFIHLARSIARALNSYCQMSVLAVLRSGAKGSSRPRIDTGARGCPLRQTAMASAPLLRPPSPTNRRKLTVVLDLDETLVCAYTEAGVPPRLRELERQRKVTSFELLCECDGPGVNGRPGRRSKVVVFERPGLRDFLRRASQIGELVLFTAGLEGYAEPLLNVIDPEGALSARLYRGSCVSTGYRDHVKDLSRLGRDLGRTVLVDNNPFSFSLQPTNGIPIMPFAGDPSDHQLLDVLLPLLESLAMLSDIRPLLSARFRMPLWFRQRGIPADVPAAAPVVGWA